MILGWANLLGNPMDVVSEAIADQLKSVSAISR